MNPLIEQLLVVQDRDQRTKAHRLQEKAVPAERAALEAKREAAKAAFEALRDRAKHNEIERRKLEVEAQSKRDAIGRYRSQQSLTRKNEEFQALLHEISRAEEEIRGIESVLTVVGGKIVYAAGPFAAHGPALLPVTPDWSPVAMYGGYAGGPQAGRPHTHSARCSHGSRLNDLLHRLFGPANPPGEDPFWGAGCACWAY